MNLGRTFRIKESMTLNIRGEFSNIFNRAFWNNPTATNAQAPQKRAANGNTLSGFGYMNLTTFSQSTGPGDPAAAGCAGRAVYFLKSPDATSPIQRARGRTCRGSPLVSSMARTE